MSLLRRSGSSQNSNIVLLGRFLLPFSATIIPRWDSSFALTSPVDCPPAELVDYLTNSFKRSPAHADDWKAGIAFTRRPESLISLETAVSKTPTSRKPSNAIPY
ncbi:unnamed protein product [Victoria cruziana]